MTKYCFILGKTPILSISEIFSLEKLFGLDFKIIDLTSEMLIVETEKLAVDIWQSRLGGTIKIGEITDSYENAEDLLKSINLDHLLSLFNQSERKIVFGFSLYGERVKYLNERFNEIGMSFKKDLQSRGFKSRFIYALDGPLSSVQIGRNKMIDKGAEILIVSGIHGFYLGKTLTIQDYRDYSQKDYGRPKRDMESGLLPPKLAKIMLNLSGAKPSNKILDPFCGSGTILQEAVLMGNKNIICSDIDKDKITDIQENINWLFKKYNNLKRNDYNLRIYQSDVKVLTGHISPLTIDAIVSEPYLGPALRGKPASAKIAKIITELEALYLAAFDAFKIILKQGSRVVIIFPLFRNEDNVFTLRILEALAQKGFSRQNPIPDKASFFAKIGPTARGSLIYQRPDQKVEREIFIFEKNA